jgi:hypothetical protein
VTTKGDGSGARYIERPERGPQTSVPTLYPAYLATPCAGY